VLIGSVFSEAVTTSDQHILFLPFYAIAEFSFLSNGIERWRGEGRRGDIRRRTGRLQESRLADLALDVHSFLVDLQLRLGFAL
jgi:hypothetical protein